MTKTIKFSIILVITKSLKSFSSFKQYFKVFIFKRCFPGGLGPLRPRDDPGAKGVSIGCGIPGLFIAEFAAGAGFVDDGKFPPQILLPVGLQHPGTGVGHTGHRRSTTGHARA